jgi:hypothetical protein
MGERRQKTARQASPLQITHLAGHGVSVMVKRAALTYSAWMVAMAYIVLIL